MSVENEVANLTTSVDTLTEAVNVKKQTLDASVADSEAARDQSQTARDTAENHKLAAESAATSATNTASSLAGFDLEAIAATKSVTPVDVFVYDTSKDSDGGAWRHRCQHTSWYNEPLNTSTRGARREFPSVAVIVAESEKVTIYDGDDPSLPMWMVFDNGTHTIIPTSYFAVGSHASIAALNGILCTGGNGSAIKRVSFLGDKGDLIGNSLFKYNGNISDRNRTDLDFSQIGFNLQIVNTHVNDVAMTVLPDAPIDEATGLPVPTIAVATDGGLSVITDSGSVYDATPNGHAWWSVAFREEDNAIVGTRYANGRGYIVTIYNTPFTADRTDYDEQYNRINSSTADDGNWIGSVPSTPSLVRVANDGKSFRTAEHGFFQFSPNPNTPSDWLNAQTTSSFNTGWMNGDIKGAFLSDTDDTDLVGSGELVTNGDFSTGDLTGWSLGHDSSDGNFSITDGKLRIENGAADGDLARPRVVQGVPTIPGAMYVFSCDIVNSSGLSEHTADIKTSSSGTGGIARVAPGPFYFVADSTTTYFSLRIGSNQTGAYGEFDNVSVRRADPDRSVNNNGLIVNGTVTREPVAPGADLVAYSGFDKDTNALIARNNPALNLGSGPWVMMGWMLWNGDSAFANFLGAANPDFKLELRTYNDKFELRYDGAYASFGENPTANEWFHWALVNNGIGEALWYINGRLSDTSARSVFSFSLDFSSTDFYVGSHPTRGGQSALKHALIRISATAPTPEQIAKIYEDEKVLFQENAQATLYGNSDAVTALAHDEVTDLLHVGTSDGRSVFQGLRRIDNTTDPVNTAISAHNGLIVEE